MGFKLISPQTSALYEDHTKENIVCAITDTLDNWNLSLKSSAQPQQTMA